MEMDTETRKRRIYRVTFAGFAVNCLLAAGKLAAGLLGRSGAMVADAVHSFSDLATDVVVVAFARVSAKPKDEGHDYGHGKFETLAAILVGLALVAVGGGILAEGVQAIRRVVHGGELARPGGIALAAAAVSIVVKEWLYRYTVRAGRTLRSPSVVANAWHHRSDALSSLGTLAGIGCAYFLGPAWRIADPIAALLVAVFIFKIAFDQIRAGLDELLERSLPADMEQEILRIVTADRHGGSGRAPAAQPQDPADRRRHRRRGAYPGRRGDERAARPCADGRHRAAAARAFRRGDDDRHPCRGCEGLTGGRFTGGSGRFAVRPAAARTAAERSWHGLCTACAMRTRTYGCRIGGPEIWNFGEKYISCNRKDLGMGRRSEFPHPVSEKDFLT